MKNNSLLLVISLLFVLFVFVISCKPEPPPPPPPPPPIPTSVTDIDGNQYAVKRFGNTLWMTENLRVTKYDTNSPHSNDVIAVATYEHSVNYNTPYYIDAREYEESPYTDNLTDAIRNSLGLLYNWSAAVGTTNNNTIVEAATQGICPNGWYLPGSNDIDSLLKYLGDGDAVGNMLKSEYGWYTDSGSGSNNIGMNCYPAGLAANNFVSLVGQQTMFWTSTSQLGNITKAEVLQLFYDSDEVMVPNVSKFQANSIRCIQHISTTH